MTDAPFDVSRSMRSARAIQTLLGLGQRTSLATTVASFWQHIIGGLEENENDFPFVILYSVKDKHDGEGVTTSTDSESSDERRYGKTCQLEGTLGIPERKY